MYVDIVISNIFNLNKHFFFFFFFFLFCFSLKNTTFKGKDHREGDYPITLKHRRLILLCYPSLLFYLHLGGSVVEGCANATGVG